MINILLWRILMAEKDFPDANFKWEFYQVSGKLQEFQCYFSQIPEHQVMDVYRVQSLFDKEFTDKNTIFSLLCYECEFRACQIVFILKWSFWLNILLQSWPFITNKQMEMRSGWSYATNCFLVVIKVFEWVIIILSVLIFRYDLNIRLILSPVFQGANKEREL